MIVTVPASARTAVPIESCDIKRLRIGVVSGRVIIRQSRPATGFSRSCLVPRGTYRAAGQKRGIVQGMPSPVLYRLEVDNSLLDNGPGLPDLMRPLDQDR